jgi:DNA repair protein SbcD/Mre11
MPMPEPIRVLHFADLHIGMENHGRLDPQTGISSRIRDFLDRLDEISEYATRHEADLVIFAGDAFKTRDPDPTQQREFALRMKKLSRSVPVLMLVGNHDIPGMAARATSVDIFNALEVDNIIVGRSIGSRVLQTRRGPIFLAWMPFPVRNRLLAQDAHRGASVEELDRLVEAFVSGEMADLARQAAEHAMPRLLAGHFSVSGAVYGSERSVMLGRDLVIQKSALADPAWDYVALGHIHKHQNLTPQTAVGAPPIVYAGSLERIDFGEEVEAKGFCWLNLVRGATTWQFVPVRARPFCTIRVDARAAADPTAAVIDRIQAAAIAGAIVRVVIQLLPEQEAALRRRDVEQALAPAASIASINIEVERETRLTSLGMAPEALTPLQWLERYLTARQKAPEQARRLLELAGEIFDGGAVRP